MRHYIIFFSIIFSLLCCTSKVNQPANKQVHDISNINSIKFIELLKIKEKDNNTPYVVLRGDFKKDFINNKDIKVLISLIHSKEKCKCYVNELSSFIPLEDSSDIGGVALSLIDDFKNNVNPTLKLWDCPKMDLKKLREIELWFKEDFYE